jgi:hypothetical protein
MAPFLEHIVRKQTKQTSNCCLVTYLTHTHFFLVCISTTHLCHVPTYVGKSHIPDGTGYQEKFYFTPGDTGFKVWDTKVGKVGVAICWDQWFPEAARAMALQGADILLYPTAIGSEPQNPTLDSSDHWQRCMQGHAASNVSADNKNDTVVK